MNENVKTISQCCFYLDLHSVLRSSFIEICSVVFLWSCKETKLTEKQTDTSENKKLPVGGESQEVFPDPKLTSSKRFLSEKKHIYSLHRFFSQLSKLLFIARHKFPELNVPTVQNTQRLFLLYLLTWMTKKSRKSSCLRSWKQKCFDQTWMDHKNRRQLLVEQNYCVLLWNPSLNHR